MSRRRYVSTDAGRDRALRNVAMVNEFACTLYLLGIACAGDDAALPTSDPEELLWEIWPSRRDKTGEDVAVAAELLISEGLWERLPDGTLRYPLASFYRYQTYIRDDRRASDWNAEQREELKTAPKIAHPAEEQRKSAQISANQRFASPSFNPSLQESLTTSEEYPRVFAPDKPGASEPVPVVELEALRPVKAKRAAALVMVEPDVPGPPLDVGPGGRHRDLLWDALASVFGLPRTKSEAAKRNAACKELRDAGYTANDVLTAHQHWPNVMRDATETPHGLVGNMAILLTGPQINGRSNGTVLEHKQRYTEYAAVNRGPARGADAVTALKLPPDLQRLADAKAMNGTARRESLR